MQEGTLALVPLLGGSPRPILEEVIDATWSPDGKELAVVRVEANKRVLEFPIGKRIDESQGPLGWPRVSPDGRSVAYYRANGTRGEIVLADRAGNKRVLTSNAMNSLEWHPTGREIWFTVQNAGNSGYSIRAVTLDGSSREILSSPDRVRLHGLNAEGATLLERRAFRGEIYFRGPDDSRERDLSWLDASWISGLTPDGQTILISEQGDGGGRGFSTFLRRTDGSPAIPIAGGIPADLSPDGKWALVFAGGTYRLFPTGAGQARDVPTGRLDVGEARFLPPDGRRILLSGAEPDKEARLWILDLASGALAALPEGPQDVGPISPNGEFVATRLEKEDKILLVSLDGQGLRAAPATLPGEEPLQWSDDGRWLYVDRPKESHRKHVYRIELATGRRELWKEIAPEDPAGVLAAQFVTLTPDGRSYAYQVSRAVTSDLYLVEGLK